MRVVFPGASRVQTSSGRENVPRESEMDLGYKSWTAKVVFSWGLRFWRPAAAVDAQLLMSGWQLSD